jgi:hypothetical protein
MWILLKYHIYNKSIHVKFNQNFHIEVEIKKTRWCPSYEVDEISKPNHM